MGGGSGGWQLPCAAAKLAAQAAQLLAASWPVGILAIAPAVAAMQNAQLYAACPAATPQLRSCDVNPKKS